MSYPVRLPWLLLVSAAIFSADRWTKTWIADYASTEEIYWNVPGDKIDADRLPLRAFDSEEQQEKTDLNT